MVDNGDGRSALVIGGASGIGWATAKALAADGYTVTVADLNADGAAARAAELGSPHTSAEVNVTDEDSVAALFERTGALDVVVTTAGFSNISLIVDMPVDQFRSVIDVCLTGSLIVAKYAGRHLRDDGSLVWISSLNARQPAAGMSAYCAAKAGLSMLTQVAAMELAPRGIRVNAVAPGFVLTPLTEGAAMVPGTDRGLHREHRAGAHRNARGHRGRGALHHQGAVAHGRGARPQRRSTHAALPRRHGRTAEADGDGMTFDGGQERSDRGLMRGKHAIVTGAGSGIGAALCRALVAAGADVVCTDVDGDAAARTADALGARSARLDVTDAAAVQAVVDEVVDRAGRLDLMFNNAGITWGGDTELLTLEQWNAIIDVNIRGVVHGVAAAYPQMVRQGHGHIVNTASMAGLAAAGQITSYVMSKHAIVGLSLALRSEAAGRGVGVLAICPTAVETPILDKGAIGGFVGRDFYRMGQRSSTFSSADDLAKDTLRAIEKNKALLVWPRQARQAWLFSRLAPGLLQRMSIGFVNKQRAAQAAHVS